MVGFHVFLDQHMKFKDTYFLETKLSETVLWMAFPNATWESYPTFRDPKLLICSVITLLVPFATRQVTSVIICEEMFQGTALGEPFCLMNRAVEFKVVSLRTSNITSI